MKAIRGGYGDPRVALAEHTMRHGVLSGGETAKIPPIVPDNIVIVLDRRQDKVQVLSYYGTFKHEK